MKQRTESKTTLRSAEEWAEDIIGDGSIDWLSQDTNENEELSGIIRTIQIEALNAAADIVDAHRDRLDYNPSDEIRNLWGG